MQQGGDKMTLPNYGVNHISGKTLEEEIEIARGIGGRLPYRAYVSLIRRGILSPKQRRKNKKKIYNGGKP